MTPAQAGGRGHRAVHEVEGVGHGPLERAAQGESGRDRRREGAARPVGRGGFQFGMCEPVHAVACGQHVHHFGRLQMPALHERRRGPHLHQRARGALHLLDRPDLVLHQDARFVEVRRDQRGEWDQALGDAPLRLGYQQPVAGGGDHHGVEHIVGQVEVRDRVRHRLDQLGGPEHAALDRMRRQVVGNGLDLLHDQLDAERLPAADADGVLRGDRRDDAGAEDAELMEGLEIGLDSRAAAGIGPRDREGDLHGR